MRFRVIFTPHANTETASRFATRTFTVSNGISSFSLPQKSRFVRVHESPKWIEEISRIESESATTKTRFFDIFDSEFDSLEPEKAYFSHSEKWNESYDKEESAKICNDQSGPVTVASRESFRFIFIVKQIIKMFWSVTESKIFYSAEFLMLIIWFISSIPHH